MLSAIARFPESLLREQGISLAPVHTKAASFCGYYPRTSFKPYSSLPLTPDTWDKYPRSPCPDAEETHVSYFRQPFHHAPSYESHQRHSGISIMLTLKPPLATLQLFPLFWLPYTQVTAYVKQGTDPPTPALAQQFSPHKAATGSPRDEGWAAAGAVVCDLEDSLEIAASHSAHFSLVKHKCWRSGTILNQSNTISSTMLGYPWFRAKALLHT